MYYKKWPDLKKAPTFDEKILLYMIYYRHSAMPIMADKFLVRQYLIDKGYESLLIPLYGVFDKANDINFKKLPKQFVLKANHGCGYNIVVKDNVSIDITKIKKQLTTWLNSNFYYEAREWVYKNIKRKIICEKYLENSDDGELIDYKVFCFHGQAKATFVCSSRNLSCGLKVDVYDKQWNILNIKKKYERSNREFKKPICYDQMIKVAEDLSVIVPFMRVDFYIIDNKLLIGELSFFPDAGLSPCEPDEYNEILGSWLHIDEITKKSS